LEEAKSGERYRGEKSSYKSWAMYRRAYRSTFASNILPVNLVYATIKNIIPRIYFRNPHIAVSAKLRGFEGNALVVSHIDNMLLNELNLRRTIKQLILDSFLCGYGVIKLGFSYQYGDSIVKEGDTFKVTGKKLEYDERVLPNFPWAKRLLPEHFITPYGTVELESAPWLGNIYWRPAEDVQQDPRFKHVKDLQPNAFMEVSNDYGKKTEVPMIKLFELIDRREGKIITLAEGAGDFLQKEDYSLPIMPYEILQFSESADEVWYPPSDVESFFPLQLDINEIETQVMHHRRIASKRFLFKSGTFGKNPQTELEKLTSEEVGVGIEVEGSPREDIEEFELDIPPSLFKAKEEVRNDIREVVGMSQNQLGAFVGKTHIAEGEGARVQQSSDERMAERRDAVANFLTRIVEKLNKIIFTKWDQQDVTPIVGPDGVKYWVQYQGNQLAGQYNVEITGEDIAPITSAYKLNELQGLIKILAQNPFVDQLELTRQLVSQIRGFNGAKLIKPTQEQGSPQQPMDIQSVMKQIQATRGGGVPNANIPGKMPSMPPGGRGGPPSQGPGSVARMPQMRRGV
jgi:hypothetical protein